MTSHQQYINGITTAAVLANALSERAPLSPQRHIQRP